MVIPLVSPFALHRYFHNFYSACSPMISNLITTDPDRMNERIVHMNITSLSLRHFISSLFYYRQKIH